MKKDVLKRVCDDIFYDENRITSCRLRYIFYLLLSN